MSGDELRWIGAEEAAHLHELGVECGKITRRLPDMVGRGREQIESARALARADADDPESGMAIFERFPAWLEGVRVGAAGPQSERVVAGALRNLAHDLLHQLHDYRRREEQARRKKQRSLEARRRTIAERRAARP